MDRGWLKEKHPVEILPHSREFFPVIRFNSVVVGAGPRQTPRTRRARREVRPEVLIGAIGSVNKKNPVMGLKDEPCIWCSREIGVFIVISIGHTSQRKSWTE